MYTADQSCRVRLTHVRTERNFFIVRTLRVKIVTVVADHKNEKIDVFVVIHRRS